LSTIKLDKEKELVGHLLSKDPKRFGFLFDHFSPALYGIIKQIVKHDEQAEDILQEVFLKIWNSAVLYDPKKSRLFTWLLNVARNTSIDYVRSKQGRFDKKSQPIDAFVSNSHNSGAVTASHEHIGLKKIVSGLKDDHKEIIDLAFFEGYTQNEIAEKLQIPLGTVKTKCRKAISILRKSIDIKDYN
jgi:RNA polymerase sigma factor (sigma-70 family)